MYAEQLDNDATFVTEAEYLAFADTQETKYEYRNGEIIAMSGGSVRHGVVTMNMGTHLNNLIGERDCSVTSPDVRVYSEAMSTYRYPDVTVFCGDPAYLEGRTDTITNPVLLVEVSSPGTAAIDHEDKLGEYTSLDSLQTYVLVSQDKAKVQVYRRQAAGNWLYSSVTGLEAEISVSVDGAEFSLSLAQIYRRVRWDEESAPSQPSDADEPSAD